MIVVSDKLSTESFHAFIDEQLTDEQYAQVEAQLDEIPEKIEEIQHCQIINERLREVFDPVVEEHVPDDLYDMALYGPPDEPQEADNSQYFDSTQFGYEYDENASVAEPGYEGHIESPLDSFDDALDLQNEEFIDDDNEFADLEALSDEPMADFDIDAMGDGDSDIIPDIFDEEPQLAPRSSDAGDTSAGDMLESLDSLSLEPQADEAGEASLRPQSAVAGVQQPPMPRPSNRKDSAAGIEAPDLELEPLDDEAPVEELQLETNTSALSEEEQARPQPGHIDVPEHVLESLESDEALTLESLDEETGAADGDITHSVLSDDDAARYQEQTVQEAESAAHSTQEPSDSLEQEPSAPLNKEPSAPLNKEPSAPLKQEPSAPVTPDSSVAGTPDSAEQPAAQTTQQEATQEEAPSTAGQSDFSHESLGQSEEIPPTLEPAEVTGKADIVAAQRSPQEPDTEPYSNKSRKVLGIQSATATESQSNQSPVSSASQSMAATTDADTTIESAHRQPDATQINYQTKTSDELSVGNVAAEFNSNGDGLEDETNTDVVAEFFAEKKANPDFEVQEVVKEFEEVSEEFDEPPGGGLAQEPYENPIEQIRQKAGDVLQNLNNRFAELKSKFARQPAEPAPNFNKPPPLDAYEVPPPAAVEREHVQEPQAAQPPVDIDLSIYETAAEDTAHKPAQTSAKQATPDEPHPAFDSQEQPFEFEVGVEESTDNTGSFSNKIGETLKYYKEKLSQGQLVTIDDADEDLSTVDRARRWFGTLSVENRGTIGGIVLLFIGLIVGGAAVSLFERPAPVFNNDKVEQLAIDAHILYTQQSQNFAGETNTSITESMQWLSARIGKVIRLADVKLEGFEHLHAIVMPTMISYATANIFQNKDKQKMTLLIAGSTKGVTNAPLTCRVPTAVDGLCSWVKDSVHYVVVANLSLSRVRGFSQDLIQQL